VSFRASRYNCDVTDDALSRWVDLFSGRRVAVLTGAGISTESGIPDYRGPTSRHRPRRPITYQQFSKDPRARARYWARSTLGWPRFRQFQPNSAHDALTRLEARGVVNGVITQNVDRLHQKSGHRNVIDLHGTLYGARCQDCGHVEDRDVLQNRLLAQNPEAATWPFALAPDGDADIPEDLLERFAVPDCPSCQGILKPDVVLFGENVPSPRVDAAFDWLDTAEVLWVIGSSLAIFSGYRFVLRAKERGIPVGIINLGETRGDAFAAVRIDGTAGAVLTALEQAL